MRQASIVSGTLRSLFRSWVVSVGVVAAVIGAASFINKTLLPAVLLVLSYLLSALMHERMLRPRQYCARLLWVVRTTFVLSAFVMFALVLIHVPQLFGDRFNAPYFNPGIPYVSGLVIFSVGALVSMYAMFIGRSLGTCRSCRRIYGDYDSNSLASSLFNDESGRQLRLFLGICLGVGIVQWVYFYVFFINVNFNSPDLFFFNFMPVAVYLLSLVFLASRYYNISENFRSAVAFNDRTNKNGALRFIVTNGDTMLLREQSDGLWDTPYQTDVNLSDMNDTKARECFSILGGPADSSLRFLYRSEGPGGDNAEHYAAFVTDGCGEQSLRGGRWHTLYEVDKFLHSGRLAPMLANELVRIYTITMAWKTYDRQGNRLYPVKHYRPVFRLRDFKEWDVDYNDSLWLQVSVENEDSRFFRARRLWRKCLDIFHR